MNIFDTDTKPRVARAGRLIFLGIVLLALSACGKESDDGDVVDAITIPTDIILNLYCADIGINDETCVLDDPDNPYANIPFVTADPSDDDDPGAEFNNAKFLLAGAVAGNPKATFYVYATALARAPSGENQWYTARALHDLYSATVVAAPPGSDLIKTHAIRAYRSVLDNFFDSSTFFQADFVPAFDPVTGLPVYPVLVRELTAEDLAMTPVSCGPLGTAPCTPLFDPADAGNNQFFARETMGSWGYTWAGMLDGPGGPASVSGPVTRNF